MREAYGKALGLSIGNEQGRIAEVNGKMEKAAIAYRLSRPGIRGIEV